MKSKENVMFFRRRQKPQMPFMPKMPKLPQMPRPPQSAQATAPPKPPQPTVTEVWSSVKLKTPVLTKVTSALGSQTTYCKPTSSEEPHPSTFEIPPGYELKSSCASHWFQSRRDREQQSGWNVGTRLFAETFLAM